HDATEERRVGDIEDREVPPGRREDTDEVDDVPVERLRGSEDPIEQVAGRAAHDEAEGDPPRHRPEPPHQHEDHNDHSHGDDAEDGRKARTHAEGRAAVAGEIEVDRPTEDPHRRAVAQVRQGEVLREHVKGERDGHGDTEGDQSHTAGLGLLDPLLAALRCSLAVAGRATLAGSTLDPLLAALRCSLAVAGRATLAGSTLDPLLAALRCSLAVAGRATLAGSTLDPLLAALR